MKVALIQPEFSTCYEDCARIVEWQLAKLDECDESLDIIVLPEYSDSPVVSKSREAFMVLVDRYNGVMLDKARQTARRCGAIVFINAISLTDTGYRNTTYAIDRSGEIVGKYFKQHLVQSEMTVRKLDSEYSLSYEPPYILELEGLRFAFLTCYDFYFYEYFSQIARQNVDIIIGCSHQRSDPHSALEIIGRFLCYNTNAYLLRSSVSLGEDSKIGGCSMAVASDGTVLANAYSKIGVTTVEIDPKAKYFKPAGYGNPPSAHYEYIEKGRRPWKYRNGGSFIKKYDDIMPYPRVCAHRGYHVNAPENSMPAFGQAVALGAEEIEFDVWFTKDEEIVSSHDIELERVSNGSGWIVHKTLRELEELDFGSKAEGGFDGLKIVRFEDILKQFAGQVIMNIHVKDTDFSKERVEKISSLIKQYDCERHVYLLAPDNVIPLFCQYAPQLPLVQGAGEEPWTIVDRAIAHGCKKVQLYKPYFNKEMIDKAHEHGIRCNVFWSDDPQEAISFLEMGADTILSNNCYAISKAVNEWKNSKK